MGFRKFYQHFLSEAEVEIKVTCQRSVFAVCE